MATRRFRSAARYAALVALGAMVVAVAILATRGDRPPLARARAQLASDDRFATGRAAGETFARVAQHLEVAVADCRAATHRERDARCSALAAALGYSQVLAAWVLDCTDPGRHEARTRLGRYLDEVAAVRSDQRRVPSPPPLPRCA